jgi:hypothetical protein
MNFRNRIGIIFILVLISSGLHSANYKEGSLRSFDLPLEQAAPLNAGLLSDQNISSSEEDNGSSEEAQVQDLILDKIIKQNKFIEELDATSFYTLPIAILAPGKTDASYALVIHHAEIHPEYAEFDAFMIITNPFDNSKVRFKADNIKFSFEAGLVGDVTLSLMDKKTTKIINDVKLNWLPGSYVSWDCNGFKGVGLNAEIELSESRFQAVNLPSFAPAGQVKTTFFADFADFNNFVIDISLPAFKVVGIDELAFQFQSVVLDFSDFKNAASFSFPDNYPGAYSGEMEMLWRGLFISQAEIFLSQKFKDKQNKPVTFYAQNILLDDYGLTGILGSKEPLPKERGVLGEWPFSIDDIKIELLTGRLKSFAFSGETQMPGTSTGVYYDAYLDAEDVYHFGLKLTGDVEFDVFSAEATLHQSSRIDVHVENGQFVPTALLNGEFEFKVSNSSDRSDKKDNPTLSLPSLRFEGLRISTVPPVLDINYLEFSSNREENELAKFPVTIESIAFRKYGNQAVSFDFGFRINLTPASGGSLGGSATVGIVSDISGKDWKFKKLEVSAIDVKAGKEGAFKFSGSLVLFEDDPVYGKGFKGSVEAFFAETFNLGATALFGRVDGYRYFSVDAFMYSSTGIAAPPFIVNGFGGGLSYKMRQQVPGSAVTSEIGKTGTGLYYVPDNNVSLGLTAGIKAGIVNENVVQGEINFGIVFNKHGGINQISFTGEAALISPVGEVSEDQIKEISNQAASGKQQKTETSEPMRGRVSMLMDFEERIFHTEIEVYLNIAGAIKGVGPNNRAGWGVLHIEPSKWYLHIGTPSAPIGVSLIGLFESKSYFMAGHDIPDAMMMDSRVLEILGKTNADFDGDRDPNQLIKGNGLAFGSKVSFDTGDLRFLIFYAAFEMGFGFDVMLLQYDDDIYCEGRDGLGINNWYAKGQIYAYVSGKIGIRARVFRRTRTFEIINLQAAAAMRMEGPNPFWMHGAVGGKYKVLGGLIRGTCSFDVTVGSKCDMNVRTQELADIEIIGDVTPNNHSDEIDPFVYPQVVFNMPVGKEMRISDDENTTKEFRVNLVEYSLYQEDTRINGLIEWNEDNTTMVFTPNEVLYPVTDYRIFVKVGFDEKVGNNWAAYKGESGEVHYESREVSFTTGNLPPEIPESEIAYTYPLKRMMNLYTDEYSKAYISFNRWIPGYFTSMEGWEQKVRWVPTKNGPVLYSNLELKPGVKTVETDIPEALTKGATYYMELVNVSTDKSQSMDRNVKQQTEQVLDEDGTELGTEIATRVAEGVIGDSEDLVFYSLGFRVSNYATLADKIGTDELSVTYLHNASPAIAFPTVTIYPNEPFDGYEIESTGNTLPLLRLSAELEQSDWYLENIFPLIYKESFFQSAVKKGRNVSNFGLPPIRPIYIVQRSYNYIMSEEDINNQRIISLAEGTQFMYVLPNIWASDYVQIRNEISHVIKKENRTKHMHQIMKTFPWPQVSAGNYPIRIEYALPGINKITSSYLLNLKNTFEIPHVNLISNE